MPKFKKIITILMNVLITILLAYFISQNIDKAELLNIVEKIDFDDFFICFVLYLIFVLLQIYRFHVNVKFFKNAIPSIDVLLIATKSKAVEQFLPNVIGNEAYKVYRLRRLKIAWQNLLSILLIDRLLGLLGLFFFIFIGFIIYEVAYVILIVALVSATFFFFWRQSREKKFLFMKFIRVENEKFTSIKSLWLNFGKKNLLRLFLTVSLVSILGHAFSLSVLMVLYSILGVNLSLEITLTVLPLVLFLSGLPISVGGWGVREMVMINAMLAYGVPKEISLTVSVLYGIFGILTGLMASICFLMETKL
jgi:uncharacterized membrane protein YbhN (UPF0104 family)